MLPTEDADISKIADRSFGKQNIKVHTGVLVKDVESHDDKVTFSFGDETGEAEYLVIAAGRGPDVEALGLEAAGVKLDRPRPDRGRRQPAHQRRRRSTRSATSSPAPRSRTRRPTRA